MSKILLVILILILTFAIFFPSPLLKVRNIQISQEKDCLKSDDVLDLTKNQIIFFLDTQKIENELKTKFPCIFEISLQKNLPSILKVNLSEDKIVAKVNGTNFYLTLKGEILETNTKHNLPLIFLPQDYKNEKNTKISDPTILMSLYLLSSLAKTDFTATNLRFLGNGQIAVYNQKGTIAVFSPQKDRNQQLDSLQQVLTAAKIDQAKISKIDLRYNNPIVEYRK